MSQAEVETARRSKQASGTPPAGINLRPDQIGQVPELIKAIDLSWLEALGDCLRVIGQALLEGALSDE
jgi:hypothetical protein